MASRRSPFSAAHDETQPLMRPMSSGNVGSLCFIAMLSGLALLWCVVDQWNRSVSDALFGIGDLRIQSIDPDLAKQGMTVVHTTQAFPNFNYPLSLAFMQFVFMGVVFFALYWVIFRVESFSWKEVSFSVTSDYRWPALVGTHSFSIFWLQALIMPSSAPSLGLFAATRALEIPATAILRMPLVGARKTMQTVSLACTAAAVLYFAYAQVADCLCVWSGHGVTLLGPAFLLVYMLVLLLPAANLVLQEGVMKQPSIHPLLMLSLMNLLACIMFAPVLLLAHVAGWEDVRGAFAMTVGFTEVSMLVAWLSLQMAMISLISMGIILMTDSFWAVALRALRVLYWWAQQLWLFYAGAFFAGRTISVSVACPHSSKWAFVMLCGFAMAVAAIWTDRKAAAAATTKANYSMAADLKLGTDP